MPDLATLLLVVAAFLGAGWVKGIVGMGLPTVAMGVLGLAMPSVQAAALLVIPSLVTNLWQLVAGPSLRAVVRRLASMMLFACVGTAAGIGFLTSGSSKWPAFALGTVLALYGLIGLALPRLAVARHREPVLSPIVGGITGVLTGATGVFVVPAVPYLSALGFSREELIQALGFSFTVSTLALAVGLALAGSFSTPLVLASAGAVLPALAGMRLGQAVRHRLDPVRFRRGVFVAMFAVGGYMAIRALASA